MQVSSRMRSTTAKNTENVLQFPMEPKVNAELRLKLSGNKLLENCEKLRDNLETLNSDLSILMKKLNSWQG